MHQYVLLGKGTLAGHLLECGAQVTGGYFADPGYKDVPDLAHLGFPIVEVTEQGDVTVTKLAEAGGMVTPATVKEQLLYEIHDPSQYLTPDVTADFSRVTVTEIAPNQVKVSGASGTAPNGQYKTSVGYRDGFFIEGEISYGGSGAYQRARLAGDIVQQRLADLHLPAQDLRIEYIGINSLHHEGTSQRVNGPWQEPLEVRLRVAARTTTRAEAERIGNEVEALYTNGPAGGGGVRVHTFSHYDATTRAWVVETGQFEILVGASSRNIRLRQTIIVHGQQPAGCFQPRFLCILNLLKTVASDEDREQDPGRWCSHAAWGQEAWHVISQRVWNLRLELGHQLEPTPLLLSRIRMSRLPHLRVSTIPDLPQLSCSRYNPDS